MRRNAWLPWPPQPPREAPPTSPGEREGRLEGTDPERRGRDAAPAAVSPGVLVAAGLPETLLRERTALDARPAVPGVR